MSISVLKRLRLASRKGFNPLIKPVIRPDVKRQRSGMPLARKLATLSSRLSHLMFAGLVLVAATPAVRGDIQVLEESGQPRKTLRASPLPPATIDHRLKALPPERESRSEKAADDAEVLRDRAPRQVPITPERSPIEPPVPRQSATALALAVPADAVQGEGGAPRATVKARDIDALSATERHKRLKRLRAHALKGRPKTTLRAEGPSRVVLASLTGIAEVTPLPPPRRVVHARRRGRDRPATPIVAVKPPVAVAEAKVAALSPPSPVERPIGSVLKGARYTVVPTWSAEDIADAKRVCRGVLTSRTVVAKEAPAVREGSCGAPAPLMVQKIGQPAVEIRPSAMLTCPMAAALDRWMTEVVQPAALETFGAPVVRLVSMSSYSCRNRYGRAETPLSEHALINAVDLSGFELRDGRTVKVLSGWGRVARDKPVPSEDQAAKIRVAEASRSATGQQPSKLGAGTLAKDVVGPAKTDAKAPTKAVKPVEEKTAEKTSAVSAAKGQEGTVAKDAKAAIPDAKSATPPPAPAKPQPSDDEKRSMFLHKVHADACMIFGTVLGPEANDAHRNHFHLDMKARRGKRGYCQ